jgi:hypothetical protein
MDYFELKSDEILCPNCKTKQRCNRGEDQLDNCVSCNVKFMYLKCYHCKKKIFFNNHTFTDGVNIKCPYEDCGKFFCKSSCVSCERTLYFPDRYQEGSKVKCPFKDCSQEFFKINCPNDYCTNKICFKLNSITDSLSNQPLYREGISITCEKCKTTFQKITCYNCLRKLVWTDPKKLIDCQKIECPYEECKKTFNKIFCPHCQKCNIFTKGAIEIGNKITCIYKECGKTFNKIFCPRCSRTNVFSNGKFIEGIKTTCVYTDCKAKFCMVNCVHCKRINFWLDNDYIVGQNIICAYPDCKKKSAKINCPGCSRINVFPNGDYCFGKNYKCIYSNCGKEFANFMCPGCNTCLNLQGKYNEGNKIICGVSGCRAGFYNFRCPHCLQIVLDKGNTLKFGQLIECPYETCKKKFNYIYCISCRRGIYYKDSDYQEGTNVKCPYMDCSKTFNLVYCTHCEKPVHLINVNTNKINSSEEITCIHQGCEKRFKISNIHLNLWTNGMTFNPKGGYLFTFTNASKEMKEMKFLNSLIYLENLYKHNSEQIKELNEEINQKKDNFDNAPITGNLLYILF